jgi:hypothetical protein
MLRRLTKGDLSKQSCHCKVTERHEQRRTKKGKELTGAYAAAMEATANLQMEIQSPPTMSGRGTGPAASRAKRLSDGEGRRRREGRPQWRKSLVRLLRWRRARGEGAEEEERVRVNRGELPPLPYLYRRAAVVGMVVVLHYPDRYCEHRHVVAHHRAAVPINRVIRPVMAMMAGSNCTMNRRFI